MKRDCVLPASGRTQFYYLVFHYYNIYLQSLSKPERDIFFFILRYLLKSGQIVTNQNRPYVGVNSAVEGVILESDNPLIYEDDGTGTDVPPYDGADADSLGGYNATEFLLKTEAVSLYAPLSHTHAASQVTAGKLAGIVNATDNIGLDQQAVRNIYAGTTDIGVGVALPTGVIYLVYE